LVFLVAFFPLAFPPTTYTSPTHLILLALIIIIILGEEYKS
jgi:hypothetical protein